MRAVERFDPDMECRFSTYAVHWIKQAIRRALPRQPGEVTATYADVRRLQDLTGYAPDTPITTGVARFVDWYRQSGFAPR